jgi:hypothetical protein
METVGVEPTPPRCKRGALPIELHPQVRAGGVEPAQHEAPRFAAERAGTTGLEPARARLTSECSQPLSYVPE